MCSHHLTGVLLRSGGDFGGQGRLLVMDGTCVTLPDSVANRAEYPYATGQGEGCGFPIATLLGLFDLRTGACLRLVKSKAAAHDVTLAQRMLGVFRAGDILLADRAFCSYRFIAQLRQRGVHVIMRLHQSRARTLGEGGSQRDELQVWPRPQGRGVNDSTRLPEELQMRVVTRQISCRGYRPKPMHFATTLLDAGAYSAEQIVDCYLRRWEVELFFDDIKTSQHMEMLRTQSPHMVARELLMHLIVYNLVRLLMVQAQGRRAAGAKGRLSYRGTLDRISTWHVALWGSRSKRRADQAKGHLLECIAADEVPIRPQRIEPRVLKRRSKNFPLMTQPREVLRTLPQVRRSTYMASHFNSSAA